MLIRQWLLAATISSVCVSAWAWGDCTNPPTFHGVNHSLKDGYFTVAIFADYSGGNYMSSYFGDDHLIAAGSESDLPSIQTIFDTGYCPFDYPQNHITITGASFISDDSRYPISIQMPCSLPPDTTLHNGDKFVITAVPANNETGYVCNLTVAP